MGVTRRDLFKAGLAVSGAALVLNVARPDDGGSGSILVSSSGLKSPPVTPWVEPLFIPPVLSPRGITENALNPPFLADEKGHGNVGPYSHQEYARFPAKKFYQIDVQNTNWSFHRDLPLAPLFTYNGSLPGPMIQAHYDEPIVVRFNNQLENIQYGFGFPDTAPHLHNMHTPSESDGYPGDFITPGNYRDQHYPMARAGCDADVADDGDERECLGTLWYHDHRLDHTAENVYKGLCGFCNVFDELDSGNETDTNPKALRLPSGAYDIMLGFTDPQFDGAGNIFFNVFDTEGHLGDKIAVNGKIQPFLNVQRRKYRFRLLDIGPSRFYQFFLSKGLPVAGQKTWLPMTLIGNDGNLLDGPLTVDNVLMGVANRMDVIVDFSNFNDQDEVYLVNRLNQTSGRGPDYTLMNPGVPVLKFIVQGTKPAPDPSQIPTACRETPTPTTAELAAATRRTWEFNRSNGAWTVNGKFFDLNVVNATVKKGSTEIWTFKNGGGGWSHPIHVHFEECQILSRNGAPPPAFEAGRKDVVLLKPDDVCTVFFRFRDFVGKYVMHCHNVVHEDHSMMIRFDIVA
jgi:FtsP/CotA-like multicopper oxidase with cupredoxin domain